MKNRTFSPALALVTTLSAFVATNSAQASVLDPLPDAEYYNAAQAVFTLKQSGVRSNGVSSSSGTSSASTSNDYDIPYLSAVANAGVGARAESYLAYWIRITGPTSTVQVHIDAEGQTTAAGSNAYSEASLKIIGRINGESDLSFKACSNCSSSSLLVNQMYTFETNSAYQIKMDAQVSAEFGSGTAWIDPFFDVPDGYTIDFSRGIGNAPLVAAVPEPSTWAMMILGFAGLGFAAHRRRRSRPAATAA